MKLWLFCSLLIAYFPVGVMPVCAEPSSPPDIVLVMADDLGWSDIGCYGGEIPTPNLDALAAGGIRFTQFYNNSVCGPTRASLLSGLYCQQVGHAGNQWNQPKDFSKFVTLGEVLQTAGYHTAMVGKWQGRDPAVERGFDRFFGPRCQAKISYFHEVQGNPFFKNGQRWKLPEGGSFYMPDAFGDHAVEFVEEAAGKGDPFFLYLAYIAPHWPLHAPEEQIAPHRDRYRTKGWDEWRQSRFENQRAAGLISPQWQLAPKAAPFPDWKDAPEHGWQAERMAVYAAQVAAIDRGVGRVIEALKEAGRFDNTLFLFLSDNGAAPNEGVQPTTQAFGFAPEKDNTKWRLDGGAIRPGSGPENMPGPAGTFAAYGIAWATTGNTPFRSNKSSAWEGGIRTPLIAHWPAGIDGSLCGGLCDSIGHVIDFMPTFCELAGADYPTVFDDRKPLPMEGISLVPVLRGEPRKEHDMLCWSAPRNQAIRMGRWKLVNPKRGEPWQLFDLENDGTETTDLADQQPERVTKMREAWEAWGRRVTAK
jgi:arylsulfatase